MEEMGYANPDENGKSLPLILVMILFAHSVHLSDTSKLAKNTARVPLCPPPTSYGSFQYITTVDRKFQRDVFVYWKNIIDDINCGKIFEYRAYYTTKHDNSTKSHDSDFTYSNHAIFLGLHVHIGYIVRLYSVNSNGLSTGYTTVYVPPNVESEELIDTPTSLKKTKFSSKPGVFELSWTVDASIHFSDTRQHNFYTLYWCEVEPNYPYQCNGDMSWTYVHYAEYRHVVSVPNPGKNYQFAISANSKLYQNDSDNIVNNNFYYALSSGMVWESCTLPRNDESGRIKNFWVSLVSGTYAIVRWKLDCTDTVGLIKKIRLMVCPLSSANDFDCKEPMKSKIISYGPQVIEKNFQTFIYSLKTLTTYMTAISIIFKNDVGIHSDPVRFTTGQTDSTAV